MGMIITTASLVFGFILIFFFTRKPASDSDLEMARKFVRKFSFLLPVIAVVLFVIASLLTVEPGHSAVGIFFGSVDKDAKTAGFYFVNPLKVWKHYDCRQKTQMETAQIPSKDQLLTKFDVSVQYRIIESQTPEILSNTGTSVDVLNIHLIPKLRSVLREQGKGVDIAEDFYLEETQQRLQANLLSELEAFMKTKGVQIEAILIRDIELPPTIMAGVESKKKRDQEAEREKAELRRFQTEQEKLVATATSQKNAAAQEAEKMKLLADAKAYEIQKINDAIAKNPAYIQLQALKSLEAISNDKSSKIYFMNGDASNPLPLMHMGEK